jgi:TonB family protein
MRATADQHRRFRYAVGLSIAVHVVALFGVLPMLHESLQEPIAPPALITRLVELPKPVAEPAPPPPAEEKKPLPRALAKKTEPSKPVPSPAPPAPEAPPHPVEPPPPVASAPQAAPAAPVAPQPQADTRAAEAATAAQYRIQLIAYAQRNKPPYPTVARENNWAGEVTLEITLRADGQAELGLRRGSGYEVLDKLALDTYQQALRAVPVPPALRGRQVKLEPLKLVYKFVE